MDRKDAEQAINILVSRHTAEITMAIVVLIHAIKQQPKFDNSLFDFQLEQIICNLEHRPICRGLLKECISMEEH